MKIPKNTITSWGRKAGVKSVAAHKTAAATEMAKVRRAYNAAEFSDRMTELLAEIAEVAGQQELTILGTDDVSLEKVVGARTRAIHDLQLLSGAPTSRTEQVTKDEAAAFIAGAQAEYERANASEPQDVA